MSDSVYVGSNVREVTSSPKTEYTGVIINNSEDTFVAAGDISSSNAKILEISADWATAEDAQRILAKLKRRSYQPFEATGALIDPAAELGDAITIGRVYSGLYSQDISFSTLMTSDAAAPQEEQIDSEYKFISPEKRQYKRQFGELRASILIQADSITAEVARATAAEGELSSNITTMSSRISQTSESIAAEVTRATDAESSKLDHTHTSNTFGWELTASGFAIKSNGAVVFKADANGITVTGDGTFTGNVYAKNIQHGGNYGTMSGSGITGGTITTTQTSSYINGGIADGIFAGDVFAGLSTAAFMPVETLKISGSTLWIGGTAYSYSRVLMNDTLGNPHLVLALT